MLSAHRCKPSGTRGSPLLFFKDVPAGAAKLQVQGKTWVHTDRAINVTRKPVTIELDSLLLTPAAAATVSWNTGGGSDAGKPCGVPDDRRPVIAMTLSRCESNLQDAATRCTPVAEKAVPFASASSLTFEGLPAGQYVISVAPPFRLPQKLSATLEAGQAVDLPLTVERFEFFGTVRLNEKPVEGTLLFESGEAVSDSTGSYTASLAADPLTNLIKIYDCTNQKGYTHIPSERIAPNARFDIDLRQTQLRVTVRDKAAGTPVAGAAVSYAPVKKLESSGASVFYTSPPQVTDAGGIVTFESLPSDKSLLSARGIRPMPRSAGHSRRRRSPAAKWRSISSRRHSGEESTATAAPAQR